MKELTLQEAALAWAQGKRVECFTVNQTEYLPISRVGTSDGIISPTCFGDLDEDRIHYKFRLAPEPPAKRYRPWTPEEVPVGALLTNKDWVGKTYGRFAITGCDAEGVVWMCKGQFGSATLDWLISEGFSHSIDGGKTWLPCGVEVEA